jgi:hypothetical protein
MGLMNTHTSYSTSVATYYSFGSVMSETIYDTTLGGLKKQIKLRVERAGDDVELITFDVIRKHTSKQIRQKGLMKKFKKVTNRYVRGTILKDYYDEL